MNETLMAIVNSYARGYHHAMTLFPMQQGDSFYKDGYVLGLKDYGDQYQWDAILGNTEDVAF